MPIRSAFPDGIIERQVTPHRWASHASPLSLLILGSLMVAALTGWLAGGRSPERSIAAGPATIAVKAPERLRNGEFFEMLVTITAHGAIADPVIAIPPALWRDMTVNTMIPAPAEEAHSDGAFRFTYAPMRAGDVLVVKIDGQINPPLTRGTKGEVALYDGDRRLGALPMAVTVLP